MNIASRNRMQQQSTSSVNDSWGSPYSLTFLNKDQRAVVCIPKVQQIFHLLKLCPNISTKQIIRKPVIIHWEPRDITITSLPSLVASGVVAMTTYGAINDVNVAIKTTHAFMCYLRDIRYPWNSLKLTGGETVRMTTINHPSWQPRPISAVVTIRTAFS